MSTTGGRQLTPPGFKPLAKLADRYGRLDRAVRESNVTLDRLEAELQAAERADRERYAEKLTGDVDAAAPGESAADGVRERIDDASKRHRALLVAVETVQGDIADALQTNGEKWAAAERRELESRRREYAEQVERLADVRRQLDEQAALVRWLEAGSLERPWKVASPPVRSRRLAMANGQPPAFAHVLDALREDAAPAAERSAPGLLHPMPKPERQQDVLAV
jgi:hypothetical protein